MIIVGSIALRLNGLEPNRAIGDLDLIGSAEDLDRFREENREHLLEETKIRPHRVRFAVAPEWGFPKIEVDIGQAQSDRMLQKLCTGETRVMNSTLRYAPVEVLFLLKWAHVHRPTTYDKTMADLMALAPHVKTLSDAQRAFGAVRKKESLDDYKLRREHYSLSISDAELAAGPGNGPVYAHDDIHRAVAFVQGEPLHEKVRRASGAIGIDAKAFRALTPGERQRAVRELFMVTGIERFHLNDPGMPVAEVYRRGMHRTVRDLLTGLPQDFCIDNIIALGEPPEFDFVARFKEALAKGAIREATRDVPPQDERHRHVIALIERGELGHARRVAEDMARTSGVGGDPHAYYLLGIVLFAQQLYPLAEMCMRKCLSRDSGNAAAWLRLGLLRQQEGDHADAVGCFERALALKLDSFAIHAHLGRSLETLGRSKEAAARYALALERNPQAPQVRERLNALAQS